MVAVRVLRLDTEERKIGLGLLRGEEAQDVIDELGIPEPPASLKLQDPGEGGGIEIPPELAALAFASNEAAPATPEAEASEAEASEASAEAEPAPEAVSEPEPEPEPEPTVEVDSEPEAAPAAAEAPDEETEPKAENA